MFGNSIQFWILRRFCFRQANRFFSEREVEIVIMMHSTADVENPIFVHHYHGLAIH